VFEGSVESVELAFIVPASKIDTFRIFKRQVESSGLLSTHTRYGTHSTQNADQKRKNCWAQTKEQDQIHVYGLDMTSLGYPEGI
jgi:ribosomal protein S21